MCYSEEGEEIEDYNAERKELEDCNDKEWNVSQEEAEIVVAVEAVHIQEEAVTKMETFGSSICDEDLLFLENTTWLKQLEEFLQDPISEEGVVGHHFSKKRTKMIEGGDKSTIFVLQKRTKKKKSWLVNNIMQCQETKTSW